MKKSIDHENLSGRPDKLSNSPLIKIFIHKIFRIGVWNPSLEIRKQIRKDFSQDEQEFGNVNLLKKVKSYRINVTLDYYLDII